MGIHTRIESPLADAVKAVGSQSAFARLIGMSQTTVYEWLRDGKSLPAELVPLVSRKTQIPAHALRPDLPDLFPPPSQLPGKGPAEPAAVVPPVSAAAGDTPPASDARWRP